MKEEQNFRETSGHVKMGEKKRERQLLPPPTENPVSLSKYPLLKYAQNKKIASANCRKRKGKRKKNKKKVKYVNIFIIYKSQLDVNDVVCCCWWLTVKRWYWNLILRRFRANFGGPNWVVWSELRFSIYVFGWMIPNF